MMPADHGSPSARWLRFCRAWVVVLLGSGLAFASSVCAEVQLQEEGGGFILSNEFVSARVAKENGNLVSLRYRGIDLLRGGRGYWSQVGQGRLAFGSDRRAEILQHPSDNGGERAEVGIRLAYDQRPGSLPLDLEIRYVLSKRDSGIYAYSVWHHAAEYPPLSLAEARYAMKLDGRVFDYMTIDERRRRVMPTGADWDSAEPAELKEVRKIVTGIHAGTFEHKYDYSAVLAETPAYGWSSTQHDVGLWCINPSFEYIAGGPTKVELTGHLDVNPGGAPTLLNMWLGSHYGGSAFFVPRGEAWTKVVGPFLIHCNSGGDHEAKWREALAKAASEAARWPYPWLSDPLLLEAAERGAISGRVQVDLPPHERAAWTNMRIGLTAADYPSPRRSVFESVDWQRDAKHYQFWTRADATGQFALKGVRPGRYTLRAFADGVAGEFSKDGIEVPPRGSEDLGTLSWKPQYFGKALWQIGQIDRTAAEFRNGDHYWRWGLFFQFPKQFPNGVNFVVGKSDPRLDWNYCQPPIWDGRRATPSQWSITFDHDGSVSGTATLRLGIAGSRAPDGIKVSVNGAAAGETGPLPDTGVMHRDGIRGYWCERRVSFDASLLKRGVNVISLQVPVRSWVEGVLYDYVRLELSGAETAQVDSSKPAEGT
jgi:rhamnogalacturonan endolyase